MTLNLTPTERTERVRAQARKAMAKWRATHPEEDKARTNKWRKENPEAPRKWARKASKKARITKPELVKARNSRWRSKPENAEKLRLAREKRKLADLAAWKKKTIEYHKNTEMRHPGSSYQNVCNRRARVKKALGTHAVSEWKQLLLAHSYKCFYCKKTLTYATATRDHVIPLSKGGDNGIWNIVPACKSCNSSKSTLPVEAFTNRLSTGGGAKS